MDDSTVNNNNNNQIKFIQNEDESFCHDCNQKLFYKTLKPLQQNQSHDEFKFKTTDFAYCLKCNKSANGKKKLFVLIEANNDEECNRAINAIHSINPDANVNVFESSSSSATSSSSESPNSKSTKNFRLLNSSSRSSFGSIENGSLTRASSFNDGGIGGSMERQESRDSGFCSFSNSSFESMKSLSINDNNNITYGPQLTIPNDLNNFDSRSPIRRKWKKEHAWRYTNSNAKNISIDDYVDQQPQISISKSKNLNIIESIEEKYELNSSTEKSISKDNSLEISLDNLNTNDSDSTPTKTNSNETLNKISFLTVNNQKKRGKLIREPTIDDENTVQSSSGSPPSLCTQDNNENYKKSSADCEKDEKKNNNILPIKISVNGRSSPPEKRATFNVQKQMSIDETYSNFENCDEQNINISNDKINDYERNVIRNRIKAINHSHKLNSKYGKHDSHRNISENPFDSRKLQNEKFRPKIPIVRVQSFIDCNENQDQEKQQQNQKQNDNSRDNSPLEQKQYYVPSSSPFKDNCKKSNIYIIDHTNKSLDDARRTIDQSSLSSLFPQSPLPNNTINSAIHHNIKYGQNHSFDCDYKSTPHDFEPKISLSSASIINNTNSMPTPTILFTQSASLDRYNYNPLEFNLVKAPYSVSKNVNNNESTTNINNSDNNNKILNNKILSSFDHQHHYSEPLIKIDQKESLVKLSPQHQQQQMPQNISASSSPSLSASYTHLYNQIEYQHQLNHHHQFHPLYHHLQQNPLSTSSPSINSFGKKEVNNKHEYSPSVSPKQSNQSQKISLSQSASNSLKQTEILNAIFNPYINPKSFQTHGYPFQTYIQNSEIIFNTNPKQFTIPQLSNFNFKKETEQFQQQNMNFKADMFDKNFFNNK
jgi:hypothetical protein